MTESTPDMTPLDRLAERNGIALEHWTMEGVLKRIPDSAKLKLLAALGVNASTDAAIEGALSAQVTPPADRADSQSRCFVPAWLEEARAWGVSLMLYELRSARDWGIGDFGDLGRFARMAAAAGADFVGVNPLHALFLSAPERASPFSPSSRLFLNPLYIAVDGIGGAPTAEEETAIARLREGELVDYAAVCRLKLGALKRAFAARGVQADRSASSDFEAFRREQGRALEQHAVFEALSAHMVSRGHGAGWHEWPEEFRDPASVAVARFARDNAAEVTFHAWLQFIAARQLAEVADIAKAAGMRIGIYLDFAVGEAPDGSATWSTPVLAVPGMTIGAPPDMFTAEGQDWNLSPPNPAAMAREDFASFRATMEALMASAGALRIDHVMALQQLFLVPADGTPADGAYIRYPIGTLLELLAEASVRHGTVVIGEDLGVVPSGFREVMAAANILSYRILYFERGPDYFLDPKYYPRSALACVSTHDMPTWMGWWLGSDIGLRLEAGLIDAPTAERQRGERTEERRLLVKAMNDAGLLSDRMRMEAQAALDDPESGSPPSLLLAAHRMIARTPSLLACARLADMAGETGQTNLPGTIEQFPNWRPRLEATIEEIAASPLFGQVAEAMAGERPRRA